MAFIDNFLNRITMYRLVLYYLLLVVVVATGAAFLHLLPYSPIDILFTAGVLMAACWSFGTLAERFLAAAPGVESAYITSLILALIVTPVSPENISGIVFLIFLSALAIGSKYLFAIGNKHLFNPAAFAIAVTGFLSMPASWWVGGNLVLLPLVLVGGLLVVRKLQRFDLFFSFSAMTLLTIILTSLPQDPLTSIEQALLHSPLIFLATIMLTEPQTTPPTRLLRIPYGALVGFLFAPAIHLSSFYFTPELALVIGNVFSYIVSPKGRHTLTLLRKEKIGQDMYNFVFTSDRPLSFRPGQYMEWTLRHPSADLRGNRRYFTIASSPGERDVHLGVRFYSPASTFKQTLESLPEGGTIMAAQVAGDFTLPKDPHQKLVFIAGGIGITPFRSMVGHMVGRKEKRDAVLLYSVRTRADIAYYPLLERARQDIGLRTTYAVTDEAVAEKHMHSGFITRDLIEREIPDWQERHFYLSGPRSMVMAFEKILGEMGVHHSRIKVDFFPGYA